MDLGTDFLVIAALVAFLIGVSKSGFAAGFEGLGVPIFAFFMSPIAAAGILLPILILVDCTNLWNYRNKWDWGLLRVMLPAAAVGICIGAFTFSYVNVDGIKLMVGLIAVWFSTLFWLRLATVKATQRDMGTGLGVILCSISGFTSHVAHAGGPPMRAYLLSKDLDKGVFMGTVAVFFYVVNLIKLGPYIYFETITFDTLFVSLILLPAVLLGVFAGVTLHKKVSQLVFTRIAYTFLLIAGIKLVWDGLSAIIV